MPTKQNLNPITKKGLEKLRKQADKQIKAWIDYRYALNEYIKFFSEGTTPPGTPPPTPPGIPPKP